MQFVELAPHVRPARRQRHAVVGPIGLGQPVIGGISVDLQDAAIAFEMAGDAFAGATVLEAVDNEGQSAAAKGPIIADIGPEVGRLGLARSRRQRWQRCLIGKDPLTLLDAGQCVIGERLDLEADLAHPLRHL